MEHKRPKKLWPIWLGSLIAVSAFSAYMANPKAANVRLGAAKAAYKAAVKSPAAAEPALEPAQDLRDSVAALSIAAPPARVLARPMPKKFPKPIRIPKRRAVPKKKPASRVKKRPASPQSEDAFLKLYHVVPLQKLAKRKTFLVEGTAFDLDSGAYVEGASFYFTDALTKKAFLIKTNDWGEYSIRLPRNDAGYRLAIYHDAYRPQYLRDWTPSMKDANPDIRKQVAAELLALRFEGMMVFHRAREDQLLDFALIAR